MNAKNAVMKRASSTPRGKGPSVLTGMKAAQPTPISMAKSSAIWTGFRWAQRASCSERVGGQAATASPASQRSRSSASAPALGVAPAGSLARHFRQTVSRSRATAGFTCARRLRLLLQHLQQRLDRRRARNGGRPVSNSYRMAPSEYTSAATVSDFSAGPARAACSSACRRSRRMCVRSLSPPRAWPARSR